MSRRKTQISTKPVHFKQHSRKPFWQTLGALLVIFLVANFILINGLALKNNHDQQVAKEYNNSLDQTILDIKQLTAKRYEEATREITDENCSPTGKNSDPSQFDVVVNRRRCTNPLNFTPKDLSEVEGIQVSSKIAKPLQNMLIAARAADNEIKISSGYRNNQQQAVACESWVSSLGSQLAADKNCARPGYSEHQTGFAVDFISGSCVLECLRTSPAYDWLAKNAADYGFIERYPQGKTHITGYNPEAWHYRYVGAERARYMKANNINTLEEYFDIPGPGVIPKVPGYETN